MAVNYPVPAGVHEAGLIIKKSRFIARVAPANTRDAALAVLAQARADYPDARHHCFAYVLGKPGAATSAAMSDDGEPSGTAGKPILNVIEHKGIGDLVVVVIRYFGGVKLGAGGLVRAYAGATERVLSELELVQHEATVQVTATLDFPQEQPLRHWADQHGAELTAVDYSHQVRLSLQVPEKALEDLQAFAGANGVVLGQVSR